MFSSFIALRSGCFTLSVFLLLCGYLCYASLPRGAVGRLLVCYCGVFWSYLLTFYLEFKWTRRCKTIQVLSLNCMKLIDMLY